VITTRSPIMLTHRSPATMHNQSPVQPNAQRLLPMPHRTSTSTPPPPPPPIFPQVSPVQTAAHVRHTEAFPKNSVRTCMESSSKQQESTTFNGVHGFSQSQLHPLQQATLLQQVRYSTVLYFVLDNIITHSPKENGCTNFACSLLSNHWKLLCERPQVYRQENSKNIFISGSISR
jgi:hypothetical protein